MEDSERETRRRTVSLEEVRQEASFLVSSDEGGHFEAWVGLLARHMLPILAKEMGDMPLWVSAVAWRDDDTREEVCGTFGSITDDALVFIDGVTVPLDDLIAFSV